MLRIVDSNYTVQARVEQAFHLNCQALCAFLAHPRLSSSSEAAKAKVHCLENERNRKSTLLLSLDSSSGKMNSHHEQQVLLQAHRSILHQCAAQKRLSLLQMLDACAAAAGLYM